MEMLETVTGVAAMQDDGKCVICSQSHDDPKKEDIKETAGKTGWKRVTMSSKFEKIPAKLAIYPKNAFPPKNAVTGYNHEGHHCLALSSFVANEKTDPTDVYLRLNYFLDQTGYSPNRVQNSIGLPGRPIHKIASNGSTSLTAFYLALDEEKPLQMHIGDHDDSFKSESNALLVRLLFLTSLDSEWCKKNDMDAYKKDLEYAIGCAENYAFKKVASNDGPWRLHPTDETIALEVYFMPEDASKTFRRRSGQKVTLKGLGRPKRNIEFPNPNLDVGPFG